jgi:hypothetical protein
MVLIRATTANGREGDSTGPSIQRWRICRAITLLILEIKVPGLTPGTANRELLGDEPGWRECAEALAARALNVVSFMDRVAKPPAGALARPGRTELLT